MQKFRNPFAMNENNEMIYIKTGDVNNKEKYKNCYCPECGEKLIPRMGKKNKWHFSHLSNKECNGNFETGLHLYAKELIKRNNKILLPDITVGEYIEDNKNNLRSEYSDLILNSVLSFYSDHILLVNK